MVMDRNQCYQEEGHDVVPGMGSMALGRIHITQQKIAHLVLVPILSSDRKSRMTRDQPH